MNNLIRPGLNPNKYVRKAYISALADLDVPVWDSVVPIDIVSPKTYILIHDFTKQLNETCKDHNGWDCSILIDIINVQESGYFDREIVDDLEEEVINRILLLGEFDMPEFDVEDTSFQGSSPNDIILPPAASQNNIARTVLTYNHTIYQKENLPPITDSYYVPGYVDDGYFIGGGSIPTYGYLIPGYIQQGYFIN